MEIHVRKYSYVLIWIFTNLPSTNQGQISQVLLIIHFHSCSMPFYCVIKCHTEPKNDSHLLLRWIGKTIRNFIQPTTIAFGNPIFKMLYFLKEICNSSNKMYIADLIYHTKTMWLKVEFKVLMKTVDKWQLLSFEWVSYARNHTD